MTILVTGSRGLVGSALIGLLAREGEVAGFDHRDDPMQDICTTVPLLGYRGIVHLAAVSRVVTGERDPERCIRTNETALRALYANALAQRVRPWVIFASSREVYGDAERFPVDEDTAFAPLNVYARSKVAGEHLSLEARQAGLNVNVVRLSSVYGSLNDHRDRLVPAFAQTAATGGVISMEGSDHVYDLTHVDDVARGLVALIRETDRGAALPPIHLVSGEGTSIIGLAELAGRCSRHPVSMAEAPPRPYGVSRFVGDPRRASDLLGWKTEISVETGIKRLIDDFAAAGTDHK